VTSTQTSKAAIDPTSKTFPETLTGRSAPEAQTFTVANTGSGTLTGLKAELGSSSWFEISTPLSPSMLAPDETATVSVRPRTGLRASAYTDTLTVTNDNGVFLTASLNFTVHTPDNTSNDTGGGGCSAGSASFAFAALIGMAMMRRQLHL
jgi:hypothetical protein